MRSDTSALSTEETPLAASSAADRLPVALFGASGYGSFHLNLLLDLQKKGLVELAAVADPAISRLPELRARLEEQQVPWYEQPEELIQRESRVKAIAIAAPIPWHEDLCRAALEQDLHVFLEKPPVPLIQDWNSLLQLDSGRKVAVAFQNIASRPIEILKQWIVEGRLGKIDTIRISAPWPRDDNYYGRSNWAGKLLLGQAPVFDGPATNAVAHLIHDAMFLASPEPAGFAVPLQVQAEVYRARPIESYDTCCLRARLENDVELTAALTHACTPEVPYRLVVTGSKGSAWVGANGILLQNDRGWPEFRETQEHASRSLCYERFVSYALGRRARPDSFLEDTRGYMLTTNGMILSSGGIHPIPETSVSIVGEGLGTVYAIENIMPLMETLMKTGKLFSEQGVPWAVAGKNFSVHDLDHLSLQPYLGS